MESGVLQCCLALRFFFFSSRRRHTRLSCDWSSDVCSSDLSNESGSNVRSEAHGPDGSLRLAWPTFDCGCQSGLAGCSHARGPATEVVLSDAPACARLLFRG